MSRRSGWHVLSILVFFTGISLLLFPGCRATKKIPATETLSYLPPQQLIQLMEDSAFHCEWMSAKVEISASAEGKSLSFSANLRMRKDSAIWLSVAPLLGIEVARMIITRDSVKLVDRFNAKYVLADYGYLSKLLKVSVNFSALQALVFGNYFAYQEQKKLKSSFVDKGQYVISSLSRRKLRKSIIEDKDFGRRINQDVWLDPVNFRIVKRAIDDDKSDRSLENSYSDFQRIANGMFPLHSTFDIEAAGKSFKVELDFSKVSVDKPMPMPFSIPEQYERMY